MPGAPEADARGSGMGEVWGEPVGGAVCSNVKWFLQTFLRVLMFISAEALNSSLCWPEADTLAHCFHFTVKGNKIYYRSFENVENAWYRCFLHFNSINSTELCPCCQQRGLSGRTGHWWTHISPSPPVNLTINCIICSNSPPILQDVYAWGQPPTLGSIWWQHRPLNRATGHLPCGSK